MRKGELLSLSQIAAASIGQPGATARQVHGAVARRAFRLIGPLGAPVRLVHDGVSSASYRAVSAALQTPVVAAGRLLAERAPEDSAALADSPAGGLALGALNGIAGDRLAQEHPELALELSVRRHGRDVPLDSAGLAEAFPDATARIAVFVHGLCETDEAWRRRTGGSSRGYGARLHDELGYTPIYVRYNTGLHVSDNGRRLAAALERIASGWPQHVERFALIGHSMGGLVARSASHYGAEERHDWADGLRHVICLGTPHLGAPLERAANVAGWTLGRLPESRPFADLFFNRRSVGIKDLRFGNCVEDDWCDCDLDEFLRDRCHEVTFVPGAAYCFVGATLSRRPHGFGGLVGDLLVHYRSASGQGRRRRIPFEVENGRHVGGIHHLALLNHPEVYEQLEGWLKLPAAATAAAPA